MKRSGKRRGLDPLVQRLNRTAKAKRQVEIQRRIDLRMAKLLSERAEALRRKAKGDH